MYFLLPTNTFFENLTSQSLLSDFRNSAERSVSLPPQYREITVTTPFLSP